LLVLYFEINLYFQFNSFVHLTGDSIFWRKTCYLQKENETKRIEY